MHFKWCKGH